MAGKNCAVTKSPPFFNIKTFPSQHTAFFFLFLTFSGSYALADSGKNSLQTISRWAIVSEKETLPDAQTQMLIIDPDQPPGDFSPTNGLRIASLSVGEADDRRPYWVRIATAAYLVEQDKDAEGKVRVDFRSQEWQTLLQQEEIPRVLAKGFQGLMLEDLDSIGRDPQDALGRWLSDLRKAHLNLILLASGSKALEAAAPYVDGYVVEGIFTAWDPSSRRARRTTREERDERLDEVENARVVAALPVFDMEYADSRDDAMARWVTRESAKRGFRPFVKIR